MAATRARAQPAIGSAQWIQDENAQISLFCGQEAEDFAFSARNEVEWINEHMAEIFSKEQLNVADVFKTPGKLRGKTPRTARKRNPLEAREPLSNIFSTNAQPIPLPASKPSPSKASSPPKIASFKIAEDPPIEEPEAKKPTSNTDSGYHGLPEDDMDIDPTVQSSAETHDTLDDFPHSSPVNKTSADTSSTDRSTTERSFHSAREEVTKKDVIATGEPTKPNDQNLDNAQDHEPLDEGHIISEARKDEAMEIDAPEKDADENMGMEESRSSSQESSPARGLVRKSSLSFAALPAREPINTKKSIGNRVSRTSQLEQYKSGNQQNSLLGRLTGGKSLGGTKQPETQDKLSDEEAVIDPPPLLRDESDSDSRMTKLHNKSSTQRLHERIHLLGKSQPPRPTKSIPAFAATTQPAYPDLSKQGQKKHVLQPTATGSVPSTKDADEDDWIQPPQQRYMTQARPPLTKSISADVVENLMGKQPPQGGQSKNDQQSAQHNATAAHAFATGLVARPIHARSVPQSPHPEESVPRVPTAGIVDGNSDLPKPVEHPTTPGGSPLGKRYVDGPLSASKSRLQSIMKTAKGLFSSSASASAQAKMEAMSPSLAAQKDHDVLAHQTSSVPRLDSGIQRGEENRIQARDISAAKLSTLTEPRKTRSSTEKEAREKEKEVVDRQQMEREKERVRQQEAAIQASAQPKESSKEPRQTIAKPTRQSPRKTQPQENVQESDTLARSVGPASHDPGRPSQVQRLKDVRRPTKPAKDASSQAKAPPVNIRIGMPIRRVPLNNTALASNLHESLPPAQAKQAGIIKKASNASIQCSGPGNNMKTSAPAGKPKALLAAERKKEQDEREAQRKLEQKRDMERRRAAQQEEARRQEQLQRQETEKQREKERAAAAEDPKKTAHKQAIEKRRQEMQKKDHRPANKAVNEHTQGSMQQSHVGATNRSELGGNRPPSRQANLPEHHRPVASHHPVNPSKAPIKRVFDPENDNASARPGKPHAGQNYQQVDSKRRRTEDEDLDEFPMRPTMAPPIRQSGIRKDGHKGSILNHNYNAAPPSAASHPNSLLKSTTTSQAYQQQLYQNQQPRAGCQTDTAKYRDGNRIPFADNPNPPHHPQQPPQPFKTPFSSKLANPARQSPHYPHGENIQLQEIPTDSEDSDSSPDTAQKRQRAASLPDWVQSPYLNNLLRSQEEYMDPDAVFGPVGSPHLEEMFRERAHKFRPRTSSANWTGQDRLTQDEIRRDAVARATTRREGPLVALRDQY